MYLRARESASREREREHSSGKKPNKEMNEHYFPVEKRRHWPVYSLAILLDLQISNTVITTTSTYC